MFSQEEKWLLNEKYTGVESEAFHADCERLQSREPLAYIIGSIPFLNCTISLDSHPLIPRPETEFWVNEAIIDIQKTKEHVARSNNGRPTSVIRTLDLCAGSGCIGVAVAKAIPGIFVDFAEIDVNHLSTINKNLIANLPQTQISTPKPFIQMKGFGVFQSDIFENITERYNFILTNPPYIDPAVDRAESSVKENEPHLALYGGDTGMELIKKIIKEAPKHLVSEGKLYMEHEPEQSKTIATLGIKAGFTIETQTDQYGIERYTILALQ